MINVADVRCFHHRYGERQSQNDVEDQTARKGNENALDDALEELRIEKSPADGSGRITHQ